MCGRYASTRSAADLAELFGALDETDGALVPDYNVAPTDPAPIVRCSARVTTPVLSVARWGLVPPWARDPSGAARMINARAETVARTSAYAKSFRERRCLVPVDGWYEWRREPGSRRQPYFMTRPGGFALGGIWSVWSGGGATRMTFSIITVAADGDLAAIHDRMPLVLPPSMWLEWLSSGDPEALLTSSTSAGRGDIEIRPVSDAVGDVRNDGAELVQRVNVPTLRSSTMDNEPTLF